MNVKNNKLIGGTILGLATLLLAGIYINDFLNDAELQISDVIVWVVIVFSWFQFATWGNDSRAQKDEMGQQISNKSGKISYYILTLSLFVLWIVDRIVFERHGDFGNVFLFASLCLAIIVHPIVEFIVARRFIK